MKLPELEKLHEEKLNKLKLMRDGYGPDGFEFLIEVARISAVCDIANAIRRDLAKL